MTWSSGKPQRAAGNCQYDSGKTYWVLVLVLIFACTVEVASAVEDDFTIIFNGRNLDGWMGSKDRFAVVDSALVSRQGNWGSLLTERTYSDFVLRFEFQLTPGANNGLGVRAPLTGDAAFEGLELQILDNTAEQYANLKDYQFHGSVYGVAAAQRGFLKPVGQWNQQEVRCDARHVTVVLNGSTILDVDLDRVAPSGQTLDGKEHPGLQRGTGHIGILGHGDRVAFRNIRIKQLGSSRIVYGLVQSREAKSCYPCCRCVRTRCCFSTRCNSCNNCFIVRRVCNP